MTRLPGPTTFLPRSETPSQTAAEARKVLSRKLGSSSPLRGRVGRGAVPHVITFAKIQKAAERRLGKAALARRLPKVKSAAALRKVTDDRYLSLMSLRVFRAGLRHDMVDAKWPAFEKAFRGFEPRKVRAMSDEQVEALMGHRRLIRHLGKLKSVHANAAAMIELG